MITSGICRCVFLGKKKLFYHNSCTCNANSDNRDEKQWSKEERMAVTTIGEIRKIVF